MELRNGKVINNEISYFKQLVFYTRIFTNINSNNRIDNLINLKQKASILNKLYLLINTKFYKIYDEFIQTHSKKEEMFLKLILVLERRGEIILEQIEYTGIEGKRELKKNIVKTLKKIKNHKRIYQNEKNNALVRVSNKVGSDLTKYIEHFI
jgi:hypothetical protein